MTERSDDTNVRDAADRVIKLEEELEASGVASIEASDLEWGRAALHKWVDELTGFVVSPGLGRVTLLHGEGRRSTISSSTLPYAMSKPI